MMSRMLLLFLDKSVYLRWHFCDKNVYSNWRKHLWSGEKTDYFQVCI